MTDPDDKEIPMGEHINPLQFCQSSSTDFSTFVSNGGGACVQGLEPYNSGNGLFVADLYDCIPTAQSMENVKQVFQGVYDVHPSADGICCPNRGLSKGKKKDRRALIGEEYRTIEILAFVFGP